MRRAQRESLAWLDEQGIEIIEAWPGGRHMRVRCRRGDHQFTVTLRSTDTGGMRGWYCQVRRAMRGQQSLEGLKP